MSVWGVTRNERPPLPRQEAAGGGKEDPVHPSKLALLDLSPEYGELVTEHGALHLQLGDR